MSFGVWTESSCLGMSCTHLMAIEEEMKLYFSLALTGNRLSKAREKRSYQESNSEHRSNLGALNHSNQAQLCAQVYNSVHGITVI